MVRQICVTMQISKRIQHQARQLLHQVIQHQAPQLQDQFIVVRHIQLLTEGLILEAQTHTIKMERMQSQVLIIVMEYTKKEDKTTANKQGFVGLEEPTMKQMLYGT